MKETLKDVAVRYAHWRKQTGARAQVPNDLRAQALSLTKSHTLKIISEALGITTKTIQNWLKKPSYEPLEFIALNDTVKLNVPEPQATEITMVLPCGIKLLLNGLDSGHTVTLISALSKGLSR